MDMPFKFKRENFFRQKSINLIFIQTFNKTTVKLFFIKKNPKLYLIINNILINIIYLCKIFEMHVKF